jgi:glycosyltransferase involved in cell wall biosynthesis
MNASADLSHLNIDTGKFLFFFPSYPRVYKNYDVIFAAARKLSQANGNFQIILTSDGTETSYANTMLKRSAGMDNVKFIGLQSREVIEALYARTDCLIFPSKLETWGLPISEFKKYDKPMLLADLPYAYETVGKYDKVCFFEANDHERLATLMQLAILDNLPYQMTNDQVNKEPFFYNWDDLADFITNVQSFQDPKSALANKLDR